VWRIRKPIHIAALVTVASVALVSGSVVLVGLNPDSFREHRLRAFGDAAWGGQLWKVQLFFRLGCGVNDNVPGQGPAIISAAFNGHTNVIAFLLDHGASINKRDKYGWTALVAAAASGHIETVRYLLSRGANINATGEDGSALRQAREKGHLALAELLVRSGAVDRPGFESDHQ
jgi:hypothetical protein